MSENRFFFKGLLVSQLSNEHLQNVVSQLSIAGFGQMMAHFIPNELYIFSIHRGCKAQVWARSENMTMVTVSMGQPS